MNKSSRSKLIVALLSGVLVSLGSASPQIVGAEEAAPKNQASAPKDHFNEALGRALQGGDPHSGAPGAMPPSHPPMPMAGMADHAGVSDNQKKISFKAPESWTSVPTKSNLRVGNFSIAGKDGAKAEVVVIPLQGQGGGDLATYNLWRGQLDLDPIEEAAAKSALQEIKPAGVAMTLVEITSDKPIIENKFKAKLVGAIAHRGDVTWFFKMHGEEETVKMAKPDFLRFLETVKFIDTPSDTGAAPAGKAVSS